MTQDVALAVIAVVLVCAALSWNILIETPRRERRRLEGAFRAVAHALELRCPSYTHVTDRVLELSADLGLASGLSAARMENLRMAACLRDLGLTTVPYELMNSKNPDDWTEEDKAVFFAHAATGAELLAQVPSLRHLAEIVRWHHAPFETSGQSPERFEIPVESRILKIAGDFAFYERTYGTQRAQEQLKSGVGTEYDPGLVNLLLGDLNTYRGAFRDTAIA